MQGYARKVQRSKWVGIAGLKAGEFPADALRNLSTDKNTLSFWLVDPDRVDWWSDAALALASTRDSLDSIEVIFVEQGVIETLSVSVSSTPGNVPVPDLIDQHVDFELLDLQRLCGIACAVGNGFNLKWRKLSKNEVKCLIGAAISANRIELDKLKPKLRREFTP